MTQEEINFQNLMIAQAMACGGSKSIEVSGTCGGESVSGEIDVCQNSKSASGDLELDSGLSIHFEGNWSSAREFDGTDSFGNSCDLEID